MGDVVNFPISLDSDLGRELIVDCVRFAEGLLTEAAVRKKYRLAESAWEALGSNDVLVEKIEAEKIRRIRDGSSKREKAQLHVLGAPDVLNALMTDVTQNARHRIDSAKVLNDFASNGPQGVPAADRISIVINLGADLEGRPIVEKYDRSKKVDVNDIDPHHIDDTPHGPWPIIAANRRKDDGGDEPV